MTVTEIYERLGKALEQNSKKGILALYKDIGDYLAAEKETEEEIVKIIQRMLKKSEHKDLQGYIKSGGNYYFTDGYRVFCTADSFGFKQAKKTDEYKSFLKVFEESYFNDKAVEEYKHIVNVDAAALRRFISQQKDKPPKERDVRYTLYFGKQDDKIVLNALYLRDLINITGSTKIRVKNEIMGAYGCGNGVEAFVLSLRERRN